MSLVAECIAPHLVRQGAGLRSNSVQIGSRERKKEMDRVTLSSFLLESTTSVLSRAIS